MKRLRSLWRDGPVIAALVLSAAALLVFLPDLYLPMLMRAFLWQWCAGSVVMALWNLVLRRWWTSAAFACSAVLMTIPPNRLVLAGPVGEEAPHLLRIAQINVLQTNDKYNEVVRMALASHADLISFQEVDPTWAGFLDQGLAEGYPYRRTVAGTDRYGIAVYSKLPFKRATVVDLQGRPAVHATITVADRDLEVFCVHTSSPGSYSSFKERNAQWVQLEGLVSAAEAPVLLFGDLNTVSWDDALQRFNERTGLLESAEAPLATWPTAFGRSLIPLDHILTSATLGVTDLRTLRIPGSDHQGLAGDIRYRP